MGIKGDDIQVSENEVNEFSDALVGKSEKKEIKDVSKNKKVRTHFYVDELALDKLEKHVLKRKLKGDKISMSSIVNTWLVDFAKTLDV